jgi:hypothetical protein
MAATGRLAFSAEPWVACWIYQPQLHGYGNLFYEAAYKLEDLLPSA